MRKFCRLFRVETLWNEKHLKNSLEGWKWSLGLISIVTSIHSMEISGGPFLIKAKQKVEIWTIEWTPQTTGQVVITLTTWSCIVTFHFKIFQITNVILCVNYTLWKLCFWDRQLSVDTLVLLMVVSSSNTTTCQGEIGEINIIWFGLNYLEDLLANNCYHYIFEIASKINFTFVVILHFSHRSIMFCR